MYDILILSLFIIISALYVWLLFYTSVAWAKLKRKNKIDPRNSIALSVILPFRNEEDSLISFLQSIKTQGYDPNFFELIAVNDHSEDKGPQIIKAFIEEVDFNVVLIDLEAGEFSKKKALEKGIEQAKHEVIITTDADTDRGENWLSSIAFEFSNDITEMLIAPVSLKGNSSFIQSFQVLEFNALQYISLCFARKNNAVLCNGANLAYKRSVFKELGGFADNMNLSSGDDIFLMHQLKKIKGSAISVSIDPDSIVSSRSMPNWKGLFEQKIRWAGKSSRIKDRSFIFLSIILMSINSLLIVLPFLEYGRGSWPVLSVTLFCLKFLVDYIMIQRISSFYKSKLRLIPFFTSFILYPFYLVAVLMLSRIVRPNWKGRKIST